MMVLTDVQLRDQIRSSSAGANSLELDAKGDTALTQGQHNTRRSTGKRLRFEIFKRDGFTCRYCGAQPPNVVLVIDHVVPVVDGGMSTADNLITSCEPCNQGKAGRRLENVLPKIDADERYLEAQQEIAEMRRYQESLAELDKERNRLIDSFVVRFYRTTLISDYAQAKLATALKDLVTRYDLDVVRDGLDVVANRIASGRMTRTSELFIPYLYGVCKHMVAEDD